ncbi:MAG: PAS domain S-box protein [Pseudomonadota bacterium]
MVKSKSRPQHHDSLRKQAEEFLNKNPEDVNKKPTYDVRKLIEELHIHQIELEMQYEELCQAHWKIEASRNRYSDLYDFAPVGYTTLSNKGLILEASLTIATMLGVERSFLIGKPFSSFISRDDQDVYYFYHKNLFETNIKPTCELRLVKDDVIQFYAQLESILVEDAEGNITQTRTAITDISDRQKAKELLLNAYEEIEQRAKDQTYELTEANKALKQQIKEQRQAEDALLKKKLELDERVKELSCLYSISALVGTPEISLDKMLHGIVNLIPSACKHPEATCARILLQGKEYKTENFKATNWKQPIYIVVHSETVGFLEICCLEKRPEIDDGPFLKEERSLFNAVAKRLGHIIEHKWYEEALRENEEIYRNIISESPVGILIYDPSGQCIEANDAIAKIIGATKEQVLQQNYNNLDSWTNPGPDGHTMLDKAKSALREKAVKRCMLISESTFGKVVRLDCHFVPFSSDGLLLMVNDISGLKKAEEALQQSQEKYQDLYDYAPDMYVSVDAKTANILDCNQTLADTLGYKKENIIGRSIFDLYTSESAEYAKANVFPEFVTNGIIREKELQVQRKDGSVIDVSLNVSAVRDKKGNVLYSRSSWRDVTGKKKLEAQLQQSHKMEALGILAGGIAHDFNNILTSIIGYTQISLDALPKKTYVYENLQHILKAGYRAKDLIKQVVTFARVDQEGRFPVMVASVLEEALKFLKATLPSMIKIRRYIKIDSDIIAADSTQIHQLLMNLCTNAAYAMGEDGGVLKVTLTNVILDSAFIALNPEISPGLYLKLSVSDTGCGIPPDIREKIFDPYFTSKDKDHGTGLGLAVVHGIVKKYGGTITVETEVGKGSTFSVYLPVTGSEPLGKPDKNTGLTDFTGNEHILLIDDDESVVKVGRKMLERLGYQVVSTTSAVEALVLFREQPDKFDLVLTDMAMPNLTGASLAKKLLEIRPDIPIILCTGNSEFINEEKAMAIGIKSFIMKPFIYRELVQTVRNVINGN